MELPAALRESVQKHSEKHFVKTLVKEAQRISQQYRLSHGIGKNFVNSDAAAFAYSLSRMPATFGAVSSALSQCLSMLPTMPKTLIDAGAGTGAASWAVAEKVELSSIICLEREEVMLNLGKALMENGSGTLRSAQWISHDLATSPLPQEADMIIASYVLNEMPDKTRLEVARKLWHASRMMLIIVEPGTPQGYKSLMDIRDLLLSCQAHIAAPCPHEKACQIDTDDWCHFACRVSRTRMHKHLKRGDAPYEDEKYTYMAFMREPSGNSFCRVLRHPQIRNGHIMFQACTPEGIQSITISARDKDVYKRSRKAKSGDPLPY